MADTVLEEAGLTGDETDKESAVKWYEKYAANVFEYAPVDKEIEFLIKNFKFLTDEQRAKIWAWPPSGKPPGLGWTPLGWAWDAASDDQYGEFKYGGVQRLVQIFKEKITVTNEDKEFFLLYGGSWLSFTENDTSIWNNETRQNILNLMQKYVYEKANGAVDLFAGVRASYEQYSFVNFKRTIAELVNDWLSNITTNIAGLKVASFIKLPIRDYSYRWGKTPPPPPENYYPEYSTDIPSNRVENLNKILQENNLFNESVLFIEYAPGQNNSVRVSDDLEQVTVGGQTEGGFWDDERQNYLRRKFFDLVIREQIRQHLTINKAKIEEKSNVQLKAIENSSLKSIKGFFDDSAKALVNKKNESLGYGENSIGVYGYKVAQEILNKIRFEALKKILDIAKDSNPTDEDVLNAFKAAEDSAKADKTITGTDIPLEQISEEEIKAKQKFLKQCLLMSRLKDLVDRHSAILNEKKGIHKELPYRGRFYMVGEQGDEQSSINKLLIPSSKDIDAFKNITPAEHASLIPKLKFYKVFTNAETGKLEQIEFKFPKHTNSDRVNKLSNPGVFDKGSDFGIKEFSFSFEGSTPATARNDIKANLSLYFQSFKDFVDKKPMNSNMSYVDLLLLPMGKPTGSGINSSLQVDASYYRIRVDVGWELDSAPNDAIKSALEKINKSFYLNMIDHDIDIQENGSININVTYRAYMESALKGSTMNALSSKDVNKKLDEIRAEYNNFLSSAKCTVEQLNTIRNQYLEIEANLKKSSLQSIIKRLVDLDMIEHVKVRPSTARSFEKTGFIVEQAVFESDAVAKSDPKKLAEKSSQEQVDTEKKADIQLKNSEDNLFINYFHLGDLLYVVLDSIYKESENNINEEYATGAENFKFIVSSFQFIDSFSSANKSTNINLAQIPISVELFSEWFTENIIKPERVSYPIMYFIRDLTSFLVGEILLETCFRNDLQKTLQFKTTSFLASSNSPGSDPIGNRMLSYSSPKFLDLSKEYKKGGILPLSANIGAGSDISNLYNYIVIYAVVPKTNTNKKGDKKEDEEQGIYHFQIGRPKGIIKKIKFSKSDMQYIREARFFRHGHDGLMQLSSVYKVSLEMVGNTLYYPGMEVFINPQGLLGAGTDFDPTIGFLGTRQPSIANKLGFGGYHIVTRVNSSIAPGKFTTTVDALFSYSGDGDPLSAVIGRKQAENKNKEISHWDPKNIADGGTSKDQLAACDAQIDYLYRKSLATSYGIEVNDSDIKDPKPTQQTQTSAVPINPPTTTLPPAVQSGVGPGAVLGGPGFNVPE